MAEDNYQNDLFGGVVPESDVRKKSAVLSRYSEHRMLPYLKLPIEYSVIIAIGALVLMILAYATGVERGKRIAGDQDPPVPQVAEETVVGPEKSVKTDTTREDINETVELAGEPEPKSIDTVEAETEKTAPPAEPVVNEPEDEPDTSGVRKTSYIIQLASFKDMDSAEEEVSRLRLKGEDARLVKKGDWYQVYSGGYFNIDEAKKAKRRFSSDYRDCFIRKIK